MASFPSSLVWPCRSACYCKHPFLLFSCLLNLEENKKAWFTFCDFILDMFYSSLSCFPASSCQRLRFNLSCSKFLLWFLLWDEAFHLFTFLCSWSQVWRAHVSSKVWTLCLFLTYLFRPRLLLFSICCSVFVCLAALKVRVRHCVKQSRELDPFRGRLRVFLFSFLEGW